MSQPSPKTSRKKIIVGIIVGVIIFIALIFILLTTLLSDMKDAARAQIDLLRNGQIAEAYQQSASGLQRKLPEDDFKQGVASLKFSDIDDYSFSHIKRENNLGRLSGVVTFKNGDTGEITVEMIKENDRWKLKAVSIE